MGGDSPGSAPPAAACAPGNATRLGPRDRRWLNHARHQRLVVPLPLPPTCSRAGCPPPPLPLPPLPASSPRPGLFIGRGEHGGRERQAAGCRGGTRAKRVLPDAQGGGRYCQPKERGLGLPKQGTKGGSTTRTREGSRKSPKAQGRFPTPPPQKILELGGSCS